MSQLIYDMPASVYHADPCPEPSLSSSILRTLLDESPLHAWIKHPRLGGSNQACESKKAMELGSAIHKLSLGRGKEIEVIQANDYRTNAAKQQRDDAIKAGRIAVLEGDYEIAELSASAAREAIEASIGFPIADCHTEVVLLWQESERYWRRAMIDLLTPDMLTALDLKSTAMSVSVSEVSRRLYSAGHHLQAAFYTRGLDHHHPAGAGKRRFGFLNVEVEPPFDCSPFMEISPFGYEIAHSEVQRGCELWNDCIDAGRWPGHWTKQAQLAEPPGWIAARYENSLEVQTQD